MSNPAKHLLEFGPFRLDPEERLLLRDQQLIPLSPKAFELLLALVSRSGQVVLKDDLMKLLWPDTFVEESNLGQHIFQLRKALGERPQDHAYIVTIPGRGYRFVHKVRTVAPEADAAAETEQIVLQSHSRSRLVIEEQTLPGQMLGGTTSRRIRLSLLLFSVVVLLAAAAVMFRPLVPAPKVTRIRPLTHAGNLVFNTKLLTDGPRIYFRQWQGQQRAVRYVSPEGGELFPVQSAFSEMDVDDLSPNGAEFLVLDLTNSQSSVEAGHPLWRVAVASGSPRPVGGQLASDARWSPDGSTIAYSVGSELDLINNDGSNARKLASLPAHPFYPQWSPDGRRLRFSVPDLRGRGQALWQADLSGKTEPLLPKWPGASYPRAGGWTPDGRYYFFSALGEGTRDIWAMREPQDALHRVNPQPVRLTAGPLNFYYPTPSKDGKSLFAIGVQVRGQMQRYDAGSRQYVPFVQGSSVDHVTFSRDAQWMAYIEYPQDVLVRSRVDGSERRQLTFPPMRVLHPQWSPDGDQLAFQAYPELGAPYKIYLVSKDGGVPALATPRASDQQLYPSWSASGDSLVFSSSDETGANPALYRLDLKSKQVSLLPGTEGLYWGQISPDGRHVVALTDTTQKLILYDTASHETRMLAGLADYPIWSADGKYVYFSTLYFRGRDAGIYRWQAATDRTEKLMGAPDFLLGGIWGVWFGLTPAGEPLVVRDLSSTDLYALDVELP